MQSLSLTQHFLLATVHDQELRGFSLNVSIFLASMGETETCWASPWLITSFQPPRSRQRHAGPLIDSWLLLGHNGQNWDLRGISLAHHFSATMGETETCRASLWLVASSQPPWVRPRLAEPLFASSGLLGYRGTGRTSAWLITSFCPQLVRWDLLGLSLARCFFLATVGETVTCKASLWLISSIWPPWVTLRLEGSLYGSLLLLGHHRQDRCAGPLHITFWPPWLSPTRQPRAQLDLLFLLAHSCQDQNSLSYVFIIAATSSAKTKLIHNYTSSVHTSICNDRNLIKKK